MVILVPKFLFSICLIGGVSSLCLSPDTLAREKTFKQQYGKLKNWETSLFRRVAKMDEVSEIFWNRLVQNRCIKCRLSKNETRKIDGWYQAADHTSANEYKWVIWNTPIPHGQPIEKKLQCIFIRDLSLTALQEIWISAKHININHQNQIVNFSLCS